VWLNAQLHDDDVAERAGLPDLATRAHQAQLILDGYRLPAADRAGFVDAMIGFAVASAAQEAIDAGVTQDTVNRGAGASSAADRRSRATTSCGRWPGEPAARPGCFATAPRSSARWAKATLCCKVG
jgi:hypothetical protein